MLYSPTTAAGCTRPFFCMCTRAIACLSIRTPAASAFRLSRFRSGRTGIDTIAADRGTDAVTIGRVERRYMRDPQDRRRSRPRRRPGHTRRLVPGNLAPMSGTARGKAIRRPPHRLPERLLSKAVVRMLRKARRRRPRIEVRRGERLALHHVPVMHRRREESERVVDASNVRGRRPLEAPANHEPSGPQPKRAGSGADRKGAGRRKRSKRAKQLSMRSWRQLRYGAGETSGLPFSTT